MGRKKLKIEKIVSQAGRNVTFMKRQNGLRKKAEELSVLCDVDVAVIAFSPSGKLYQYSNRNNIEDVITRFANLTPDEKTAEKFGRRLARQLDPQQGLEAPRGPLSSFGRVSQFGRRLAGQLDPQQGLEAPRGGYADIKLENQALKEAINKTNEDKTFWDQKAKLYSGTAGIENITSLDRLNIIKEELVGWQQRLYERITELNTQAESFSPSDIPSRMAEMGPAQDLREVFPGTAQMGQDAYHDHMGGQRAPTAENNYGLESRLGQGKHFNCGTTQIGGTSQQVDNNGMTEVRYGQAVLNFNSGTTQMRETSQHFNDGTAGLRPGQGAQTCNNSGCNFRATTQINFSYDRYGNTDVGQPQKSPVPNQLDCGDTAVSRGYIQPQPLQPPGGWPGDSPHAWLNFSL